MNHVQFTCHLIGKNIRVKVLDYNCKSFDNSKGICGEYKIQEAIHKSLQRLFI